MKARNRFASDRPVWERQDWESSRWYSRFERYYLSIGSERSLRLSYRLFRTEKDQRIVIENFRDPSITISKVISIPQAWWDASKDYHWKERAEAYDDHARAERLALDERLREDARIERRAILRGMKAQLAKAIQHLNSNNPDWDEIQRFAKVVLTQEREEYDELPTQKTHISGDSSTEIKFLNLPELSGLTDAQLEQLIEIAGAIDSGGADGEETEIS